MITIAAYAKMYGVSISTVKRWIAEGRIAGVVVERKPGGGYRTLVPDTPPPTQGLRRRQK
jgi:transposase